MFEKILYPTDFSDVAMKALDYIKQLREGGSRKVIVLHVIDSRGDQAARMYLTDREYEEAGKRIAAQKKELLDKIQEELKEAGLEVDCRIKKGVPLIEILKTEEDEDISVIVMGSHGMSNIEEMLLGSVSEKVIRKSKKPVLVIKR